MSGQLVDIGINLMHRRYDRDREAVIARAVVASVSRMVITGTSEADSVKAQAFAARSQAAAGVGIYATAGVHPHHAKDFTAQTLATLQQLAARPEVVAIGECGLDFNRDFSPRPVQERVFAAQLALAAKVRKPVFLHDRDAHPRFLAILKEQRAQLCGGVVHCFTGTREELSAYLALDMHIGITGWICDERRGQHLRELVKHIPLQRLMLETDGPFLLPRDLRAAPKDGRNEPAFLPHICASVAACLRIPAAEVAAATTATALRLFGLK